MTMRGRRIPIPLPNTGAMLRRRNALCFRASVIIFLVLVAFLQFYVLSNSTDNMETTHMNEVAAVNDSTAAILQMVPPVLHKFLTAKPRNHSRDANTTADTVDSTPSIAEIKRQIRGYNDQQSILNEDIFGPLQNDSVIIVVQVHKRITYLRHLIVSLAQARDISRTLLIFSHDFYLEEINDLVQSIDFCKVMQIFYPYSIQTHQHEFPGADPLDCPRDMKREQAEIERCNNYQYPDLYGHYREAKFTQTKHHWWWKANRVFDELEVTRYHTGLVVFLEEDHYVAEDFLHLLALMQTKGRTLCPKCNILSLGTYLKTFNYYSYNNNKNRNNNNGKKAFNGQTSAREQSVAAASIVASMVVGNTFKEAVRKTDNSFLKNANLDQSNMLRTDGAAVVALSAQTATTTEAYPTQWGYQVLPTLYATYQKVEITPWISSKHNMGMVFNKTTWHQIVRCAQHFCSYDDYNWDWSLQHVSQHCLKQKLHAMVVKGPRVFHIGECGVHHKKKNCESNQVISKVQKVLQIVTRSGQMYPRSITMTMASVISKNTKLRKGNGGWGDKRDHSHCFNMTLVGRN